MRLNVSHLLKAPVGTREVLHLNSGAVTLGDDLNLHYLRGDVGLTRIIEGLLAEGELETAFDYECVRCLMPFPLSLTVELEDLMFALPRSSKNHQYRISEDGWIYLNSALREQILLSIPMRTLCRPDCKGLCSQCGQNWNEGPCDCLEQGVDPRLAILRDLL